MPMQQAMVRSALKTKETLKIFLHITQARPMLATAFSL